MWPQKQVRFLKTDERDLKSMDNGSEVCNLEILSYGGLVPQPSAAYLRFEAIPN